MFTVTTAKSLSSLSVEMCSMSNSRWCTSLMLQNQVIKNLSIAITEETK